MTDHNELICRIFEGQYKDELSRKESIYSSIIPLTTGIGLIIAGISFVFTRIPQINISILANKNVFYLTISIYASYIISIIMLILCVFYLFSILHNNKYKYLPSPEKQFEKYKELEKFNRNNQNPESETFQNIRDNYITNLASIV